MFLSKHKKGLKKNKEKLLRVKSSTVVFFDQNLGDGCTQKLFRIYFAVLTFFVDFRHFSVIFHPKNKKKLMKTSVLSYFLRLIDT